MSCRAWDQRVSRIARWSQATRLTGYAGWRELTNVAASVAAPGSRRRVSVRVASHGLYLPMPDEALPVRQGGAWVARHWPPQGERRVAGGAVARGAVGAAGEAVTRAPRYATRRLVIPSGGPPIAPPRRR
jgi:hypothetical protein